MEGTDSVLGTGRKLSLTRNILNKIPKKSSGKGLRIEVRKDA